MKELVEEYYIEPEKISSSSSIAIAEGDDDMEEAFEPDEQWLSASNIFRQLC